MAWMPVEEMQKNVEDIQGEHEAFWQMDIRGAFRPAVSV